MLESDERSVVRWMTEAELRAKIQRLEVQAGMTATELREARKTWDMTVDQRDCLDEIESAEWLLGGVP